MNSFVVKDIRLYTIWKDWKFHNTVGCISSEALKETNGGLHCEMGCGGNSFLDNSIYFSKKQVLQSVIWFLQPYCVNNACMPGSLFSFFFRGRLEMPCLSSGFKIFSMAGISITLALFYFAFLKDKMHIFQLNSSMILRASTCAFPIKFEHDSCHASKQYLCSAPISGSVSWD